MKFYTKGVKLMKTVALDKGKCVLSTIFSKTTVKFTHGL